MSQYSDFGGLLNKRIAYVSLYGFQGALAGTPPARSRTSQSSGRSSRASGLVPIAHAVRWALWHDLATALVSLMVGAILLPTKKGFVNTVD